MVREEGPQSEGVVHMARSAFGMPGTTCMMVESLTDLDASPCGKYTAASRTMLENS